MMKEILGWPPFMRWEEWAFLVGRVLFGGYFVYSGIGHFMSAGGIAAAAAAAGVPAPTLAVLGTGALLLVGGALVVLGLAPRLGLALILLFLVGVTPVMHGFWGVPDPAARAMQLAFFLRNLAFAGASLALLVVPTPWPAGVGGAVAGARERRARVGRRAD